MKVLHLSLYLKITICKKNEDIKPPIIIEDFGLWNNEVIMPPTMIDDYGL
jgi:hypothetical protein